MVLPKDSTKYIPSHILEMLAEGGLDGLGEAVKILLNAAMLAEREKYLGAAPYERSEKRRSQGNGFKKKTLKTRVGEIGLSVPQTRDGQFYPNSLEKGAHSERALRMAV